MNKKETIARLEALKNQGCEIAEVIVDISAPGEVTACYPKESFIVYLVSSPNNDDLIIPHKHWTVCRSIRDFRLGTVFGESAARRTYSNYFVSKVHSINEFISDFK